MLNITFLMLSNRRFVDPGEMNILRKLMNKEIMDTFAKGGNTCHQVTNHSLVRIFGTIAISIILLLSSKT